MTKFRYGETEIELPDYKLREIKASAPFIDRVLASRRSMVDAGLEKTAESGSVLEGMTSALSDIISVIAVGVLKSRAEFPYRPSRIQAMAEEIEAELDMSEISDLNPVFDSILRESGMVRAVPPTRRADTTEGTPLPSASTESLPSSSPPDAPVETGTE